LASCTRCFSKKGSGPTTHGGIGEAAADRVRISRAKEDPAAFLKIGLHFSPREISIEHTNAMTEMSDEELSALLARAQAMLKIVDVTPEKVALPAPKVKP
jgi:hypothetical protein